MTQIGTAPLAPATRTRQDVLSSPVGGPGPAPAGPTTRNAEVEGVRDPYRELAPFYDLMAADPGIRAIYAQFRALARQGMESHHIRPRVVVDLACGTGNTTVPWLPVPGVW
jgi:hypothetical protein